LTAISGKQPSTIFTDQDAAMAGAIAYVFPNTSYRLCLWYIYLNATKHLSHVIRKYPEFLYAFKRCVYEDRSEEYFIKMWNELLSKYNLQENSWLLKLYDLREKWAVVYRSSFTVDMTTTQKSEGMNNIFKKRFRRKFGLSELLVEYDKVSASLRENELDEDFKTLTKIPVTCVPNLPLFKSAVESYTRRMYKKFQTEFTKHHEYFCKLLETEGSTSTFMVTHMHSDYGATVVFNIAESLNP
jgi:zinc finger SWIM domain-containing protein 3